jgi:hypothetical protein
MMFLFLDDCINVSFSATYRCAKKWGKAGPPFGRETMQRAGTKQSGKTDFGL